jgi:hypothetical protein
MNITIALILEPPASQMDSEKAHLKKLVVILLTWFAYLWHNM